MELAERQRLANIQDRVRPILDSFGTLPPSARRLDFAVLFY